MLLRTDYYAGVLDASLGTGCQIVNADSYFAIGFCRLLYGSRPGIETRFVRFTRVQQNFRGFNFCKWLLTREKRENKYLAKITNHTVQPVK